MIYLLIYISNKNTNIPGGNSFIGQIDVDQAQLTGESLPVTMYAGDSCMMGSTVVRGEVEGTVEFTGANTFFGKTASLLGATNETSNLQKTLVSIVLVLTVLSVVFCLI